MLQLSWLPGGIRYLFCINHGRPLQHGAKRDTHFDTLPQKNLDSSLHSHGVEKCEPQPVFFFLTLLYSRAHLGSKSEKGRLKERPLESRNVIAVNGSIVNLLHGIYRNKWLHLSQKVFDKVVRTCHHQLSSQLRPCV